MASPNPDIQSLLKNILLSRKDIALLACQQRAKFEGWLKFELASALYRRFGFEKIIIEDSYTTNGRSDNSFEFDGAKWFIEMKTANTNWRAENLKKSHSSSNPKYGWNSRRHYCFTRKKCTCSRLGCLLHIPCPRSFMEKYERTIKLSSPPYRRGK